MLAAKAHGFMSAFTAIDLTSLQTIAWDGISDPVFPPLLVVFSAVTFRSVPVFTTLNGANFHGRTSVQGDILMAGYCSI
jgi:hypothetical protein